MGSGGGCSVRLSPKLCPRRVQLTHAPRRNAKDLITEYWDREKEKKAAKERAKREAEEKATAEEKEKKEMEKEKRAQEVKQQAERQRIEKLKTQFDDGTKGEWAREKEKLEGMNEVLKLEAPTPSRASSPRLQCSRSQSQRKSPPETSLDLVTNPALHTHLPTSSQATRSSIRAQHGRGPCTPAPHLK